jgi:hypothetical protein
LPEVLALATDPEQPGVVYAGLRGGLTGPDPFPSIVYHGGIYKSTDGGDTWQSSGTGIPLLETTPLSVGALLVDSKNPKHLYAGARELYQSTDWGSFPQMADGQLDDATFRTELVLVNTGPDTSADIFFRGGLGSPVEFELEGLGPKSSISLDLPAGRAVSLKTKGTGALHTGYATILPYGIGVHGFVVVVQSDALSSTEATVMASREQLKFSFCFDASDSSVNTGFAIAGKGDRSVLTHVECKLYDPSAQLIATRKFDFMPEGHSAQFATELFPEIRNANMSSVVLRKYIDHPRSVRTDTSIETDSKTTQVR